MIAGGYVSGYILYDVPVGRSAVLVYGPSGSEGGGEVYPALG